MRSKNLGLGLGSGVLWCIAAALLWINLGAAGEAAAQPIPGPTPPSPVVGSDCFTPHGTPGCSDACIQAAVCAVDSFCCSVQWDSICVGEATSIGCPVCPGSCGGGPPQGDCFTPTLGTPGCTDACIEAAVCAADPFCCSVEWDILCVGGTTSVGCPACPGSPGCGGGPSCDVTEETDCYTSHGTPGCTDPCIQDSVCAVDPFCCSVAWDSICVSEAFAFGVPCDCDDDGDPDVCEPDCDGDGTPDDCEPDCDGDGIPDDCDGPDCDGDGIPDECEPDGDGNGVPDDCDACNLHIVTDCFTPHGTPGCTEPCIQDSVCLVDPFCCSVAWDSICVGEAFAFGVPCDCDGDSTPDACQPDCDADGTPDTCEPDCDLDGIPDDCDGPDCDGDLIPDECEPDCDLDGLPDDCEADGDGNGIPDDCDLCNLHVVTDCFSEHGPGCSEPCIEASVCAVEPFCCDVAWDANCVALAASVGTPCDCDGSTTPDVCEGYTSSQVPRNGSPPNPVAFLVDPAGGPILGGVWSPSFDHTTFRTTSVLDLILVAFAPTNLSLPPFGTLLCIVPASPIIVTATPPNGFAIPVPPSCSALGVTVYTQGGSMDAAGFPGFEFTNAIDITFGFL